MKTNPEEFSAFIGERAWGGYFAAVGVGCLAFWGILCALTLINVLIADHGTMLGSLRIMGVIIGACVVTIPVTFAIGSVLALFPFLLTYAVAKFLHIRNMSYFIIGGGLVAALVCGSFFSIALSSWVRSQTHYGAARGERQPA
jgi:hypothetical protein